MKRIKVIMSLVIAFVMTCSSLNVCAAEVAQEGTKCPYYDYIYAVSQEALVDPCLIVAIIEHESSFDPDAKNGSHLSLMQINPKWQKQRMEELGLDDLSNPLQNIKCGVYYIRDLISTYNGNIYDALMDYNGGPAYQKEMKSAGKISGYAKDVLNRAVELNEIEYFEQ